jgi:hypothetical protein
LRVSRWNAKTSAIGARTTQDCSKRGMAHMVGQRT